MDNKEYKELLADISRLIDEKIDHMHTLMEKEIQELNSKIDKLCSVEEDVRNLEKEMTMSKKDIEIIQEDIQELKTNNNKKLDKLWNIISPILVAIILAAGAYFIQFK